MRIASKAEFYRLWRSGALGNRPRAWATVGEALASMAPLVAIRGSSASARRLGGAPHWIVWRDELEASCRDWHRQGFGAFALDEPAPDHLVLLQGEVCRTWRGWGGTLGVRTGVRMREAMASGLLRAWSGLAVKALLDQYLDPSSREDIDALLDLYPDATIEFASYKCDVGIIPGRNTLIWEVRDY